MPRGIPTTPEAFWQRAIRVGPCLEWQWGRHQRGYGRVEYKGRSWRASRLAWYLTHGPIPDGLYVCHTCDNPPCIEPLHLFLGTNAGNQQDAVAKGRHRENRGATNPRARLTATQVQEIRALASTGVGHREIAGRYGVGERYVSKIVIGERWATVI